MSFSGKNRLDDKAYREFMSLARSSGVHVSLGSDAHDLEGIGRTVEGTRLLEELGFSPQQLWTPAAIAGHPGGKYRLKNLQIRDLE